MPCFYSRAAACQCQNAEADPGGSLGSDEPPLRDRDALKKIMVFVLEILTTYIFFKVKAFVHCRLHYCNSLLTGAADVRFKRLQSDQNAAARLVSGARRHDSRPHHPGSYETPLASSAQKSYV